MPVSLHPPAAEPDEPWEYHEVQESIERGECVPPGEGWVFQEEVTFGSLRVTRWRRRRKDPKHG